MTLKILVISNLFPPHSLGGYEILCAQVCRELEEKGHKVLVLTSDHGLKSGASAGCPSNVNRALKLYLPFDQPPRLLRRRRWRVGKYNYRVTSDFIALKRPDLIFIWSQLRLTIGAARAAQDSKTPVAYTFNDEHIAGYLPARFDLSPKALARYVADNWIFSSITLRGLNFKNSTCISHCLKNNLLARSVPLNDAKVIYQGIPLNKFFLKAEMGKINNPVRVLYVGQLHPYKGVHTLIEAVHLLASLQGGNFLSVSIVGDGPSEYKKQLIKKGGQGEAAINLLGKRPHDELAAIYREHDIFIFPSIWEEPFGLTHLEAMASGTPVISTAEGGQKEFLEDEENSLIFPKEDAKNLAQQILRLINDPSLRLKLAANAREMVAKRFSMQRYVTELESFLHAAVKG